MANAGNVATGAVKLGIELDRVVQEKRDKAQAQNRAIEHFQQAFDHFSFYVYGYSDGAWPEDKVRASSLVWLMMYEPSVASLAVKVGPPLKGT